ncbi:alpha/beta fold hydrolase [Pseudomarimonas arenosa]|uniref:Alpha/beta hydrolase n=1 Tax=Pseudomarimonas arenosa TaxID=2774145 RepID=A0AAW3ZS38_9GAMM|nr:alpha/beta hydrolase [Pseudomarimonas arenosa]MBD8527680.1 alpha/beta hydrolase [Pseudomarimonas arenosa]
MDWNQWRVSGDHLQWRDQRVFYRMGGRGPALLLIHGFPTSSWDWQPLWRDLARDHQLIAPDLLGFGASSKPYPHRYSIFEQADLCADLITRLRIDRAQVLAHDYGDTVAQELLARQQAGDLPFQIERMVFLNGGLFPECHRPLLLQKLLLSPLGPLLRHLIGRSALRRSMRRIFAKTSPPSEADIDAFWAQISEHEGQRCLPSLLGYIPERAAHRQRWVGAMQASICPLGFINGSNDPISGAHMLARWRELLPQHGAIALDGVGHYPQIEAPAQVLDAYRCLLRGDSMLSPPPSDGVKGR